jgi:DNA-binding response OmpR family regulator
VQELPLILVVEDDHAIQSMVGNVLAKGGSEPAIASSGEQAVMLLKNRSIQFYAVVTDVKLPGRIDGWDLARIAREIDPALSIIYMTAANADQWASHGVPRSVLVVKPFAPAQILTAVWQLSRCLKPANRRASAG